MTDKVPLSLIGQDLPLGIILVCVGFFSKVSGYALYNHLTVEDPSPL